jgi:predicted Zn-dependent peptidase
MRRIIGFLFCLFLAAVAFAKPPAVGPFPPLQFKIPQPVSTCLSSGATVYILADHELPLFSISVRIRTGSLFDPPKMAGLGEIFADVFRTGGTRSVSPKELNKQLELMAASLEAGMGDDQMTVGLSALSRDFDRAMNIFQDVMTHPDFQSEEFSLKKSQMIEGIRRRNDNPEHLTRRYFRRLYYGPESPRGREPEVSTVESIRREDLIEFYANVMHPDRMIISVSGDVQPLAVIHRLEKLLKGIKTVPETPLPAFPAVPAPVPGLYLLPRELDQSQIAMGEPGIARHAIDHFAMEVADMIVGGDPSSRLFSDVRSRQGLAYAVESFSVEHAESGVVGAGCETKSKSTVQALRSIQRILKQAAMEGVSDQEIDFAKEILVNSFVFQFTSPEQIVDTAARLDYEGYPSDYLENYTARLQAVSRDDVNRVLSLFWNPDLMTVLVVGNESTFAEKLTTLGPVHQISFEP